MQIYNKNNNFLIYDKYCKTTKIVKYYKYTKKDKYDPILMFLYFQGVKKRTKVLEKLEFELKKNLLYDLKCDINITNYQNEILIAKSVDFINLDISHVDEVENNALIKDFLENTICDEDEFNNAVSDYKMELKALKDDFTSYAARLSSDVVYEYDDRYITYDAEMKYIENIKMPEFNFELIEVSTLVRSNQKEFEFGDATRHQIKRYEPRLKDEDMEFDIKLEQANHFIYYQLDKCSECELKLLSAIIGGFPTSRLFREVREKNSLCYFVYSRDLGDNNLYIHTGLKYENINKAEEIIKNLLEVEITQVEMDNAKNQLISFYNKKRSDFFMNKKLIEDYLFENKDYEVDVITQKIANVDLDRLNYLLNLIVRKNSITIK